MLLTKPVRYLQHLGPNEGRFDKISPPEIRINFPQCCHRNRGGTVSAPNREAHRSVQLASLPRRQRKARGMAFQICHRTGAVGIVQHEGKQERRVGVDHGFLIAITFLRQKVSPR